MKVRGRRECQDCGCRWSYYETGGVACPECESLRSVGVDDRTLHTDAPATLDLSSYRAAAADGSLPAAADDCKRDLRTYLRRRGFVDGGELRPLDDTVLAANELLQVMDLFDRSRNPGDEDRRYLLALLRGADEGERPDRETVSEAWASARGLGYADAVADYRRDVLAWLDEHPDAEARSTLGSVHERVKRTRALGGDIAPARVESLVRVARDVGTYLVADDRTALARARERLR